MNMPEKRFAMFFLVAAVFVSGCVDSIDVSQIVKNSEIGSEFLAEYPNARITAVKLSEDAVGGMIDEIREQCDSSMAIKPYWKVKIYDPDSGIELIAWVDAENNELLCIVKEGSSIPVTTPTTPGSPTPPETIKTCTDSDGGKKPYIKGTVVDEDGNQWTDKCIFHTIPEMQDLSEFYCDDNGNIQSVVFDCEDGCRNGVCIPKEECDETRDDETICNDIREDPEYGFKFAMCNSNGYDYVCYNKCEKEYSSCARGPRGCTEERVNADENILCAVGDWSGCTDSDSGVRGVEEYVYGYAANSTYANNDMCWRGTPKLIEYYCTDNYAVKSRYYKCVYPYACKGGECVRVDNDDAETPFHCDDTDGGKDFYTKGEVTISNGDSYTDYCEGAELIEYYCDGNLVITISYTCESGCAEGACIEPSPETTTTTTSTTTTTTTLPYGQFIISLRPGWNPVSPPIDQGIRIAEIEDACGYVDVRGWEDGQYVTWNFDLAAGDGYFVIVLEDCNFTLDGRPYSIRRTYLFANERRLVGAGSTDVAVEDILGTCVFDKLEALIYDMGTDSNIPTGTLEVGKSYWMTSEIDCIFGVDTASNICPASIDASFDKEIYYIGEDDAFTLTVKIYNEDNELIPNSHLPYFSSMPFLEEPVYTEGLFTDDSGIYQHVEPIPSDIPSGLYNYSFSANTTGCSEVYWDDVGFEIKKFEWSEIAEEYYDPDTFLETDHGTQADFISTCVEVCDDLGLSAEPHCIGWYDSPSYCRRTLAWHGSLASASKSCEETGFGSIIGNDYCCCG